MNSQHSDREERHVEQILSAARVSASATATAATATAGTATADDDDVDDYCNGW